MYSFSTWDMGDRYTAITISYNTISFFFSCGHYVENFVVQVGGRCPWQQMEDTAEVGTKPTIGA